MDKILLVFEDYSAMVQLETTIRKLGFDAVGITNEMSLSDQVVTFNPDIIVAFGKGQKVSSVRVAQKLREMLRWQGKVLLILQQGQKINPDDLMSMRMDLVLEAPFEDEKVIQILARFGGLDEEALVHKFQNQKIASTEEKKEDKKEFVLVTDSQETIRSDFKLKDEPDRFKTTSHFDLDKKASDSSHKNDGKNWSLKQTEPASRREIDEQKNTSSAKSKKESSGHLNSSIQDESRFVSGIAGQEADEKQTVSSFPIEESLKNPVSSDFDKNLQEGAVQRSGTFEVQPEVERVISQTQNSEERLTEAEPPLSRVMQELEEAARTQAKRVSKYSKFLKGLSLNPLSSLNRKATRAAQNNLMLDIQVSELEDQDEMRRDFTRALFKKKR